MIAFPNCKINLGLSVTGKRHDGYHNLETCFYPLAIKDAIEIIPASANKYDISPYQAETVQFSTSGLAVDGPVTNNLCVKAYHLLKKDFPTLPSISMHLHKAIPMGAGLGGGSADGAFVLTLLNKLFNLALSTTELIDYALKLGSDCPFFILNRPCIATGRGEIMDPVALNLSAYSFVIVNAGINISTGWAFSQLNIANDPPRARKNGLAGILNNSIESWKGELINDFEEPVFQHHPLLRQIKDQLYAQGALYASMSGSGSTVFGIFKNNEAPKQLTGLRELKLHVASNFNL